MKKEFFAIITIVALVIGSIINIIHLKDLVNTMSHHITNSISAYNQNDYSLAEQELSTAMNVWLESDGYTHVFIRHSEIDAVTDTYYDALTAIQNKESASVTLMRKIQYHIQSILSIECVSFKSVF